jgi:hypothetical protein
VGEYRRKRGRLFNLGVSHEDPTHTMLTLKALIHAAPGGSE